MTKTYTTSKGSVLPLMQLKGKDYMLVANRIVWLVDEVPNYNTNVEFLVLTEQEALAKVTLSLYDKEGRLYKQVTDVKRESKSDFSDFTEKAVTGALGRCLGQAGFGTAYAQQDLDEGHRIVDAPLEAPPTKKTIAVISEGQVMNTGSTLNTNISTIETPKKTTFRRPSKPKEEASTVTSTAHTSIDTNASTGWE